MIKDLIPFIIAVIAVFYGWSNKQEAERKEALYVNSMANNEFLIKNVRKVYNDKLQTEKRNKELEQAALQDKQDKVVFDWYADISNSSVIKQLQAD